VYKLSTLRNGLKVATAEMPHMTSVSVGIWVSIGSRYEAPEVNGICHFIEHLLFKGTRRRSARDISHTVEGMGGYLNAFTSEETSCFHAKAPAGQLEELVDVLLDMFLHSRFAPEDVDKERGVIKEEISMYLDEPQHHVQELLNATMWPGQALGRTITGTEETLNRLGSADLKRFMRRNYVPKAVFLVGAGKLRHTELVKLADRLVRELRGARRAKFEPAAHGQQAPRVRMLTRRTEQTQMAFGIRTCSRHDPRRFAVRLLNTILGESMSSRLFQLVREDLGLTYSIYSAPTFFEDTGDLVISAGLDSEKLSRTLRLVLQQLHKLTVKPPGQKELQRAKDYVMGQMDLALENTESQMNLLGEQLLGYGKMVSPGILKQHLNRVTSREIATVAKDFFRPDHFNLALVSPLRNTREIEKILRSY